MPDDSMVRVRAMVRVRVRIRVRVGPWVWKLESGPRNARGTDADSLVKN